MHRTRSIDRCWWRGYMDIQPMNACKAHGKFSRFALVTELHGQEAMPRRGRRDVFRG